MTAIRFYREKIYITYNELNFKHLHHINIIYMYICFHLVMSSLLIDLYKILKAVVSNWCVSIVTVTYLTGGVMGIVVLEELN